MTEAIHVANVTKIYRLYKRPMDRLLESMKLTRIPRHKDLYALDHVSFSIPQGDIVGIIGVNGSGKSTILKIITGVLTPTSGDVQVNGRISALLELGAGFNPDYTGIENIRLSGTMMNYTNEEIESKIPSIMAFADIGEYIYQPVKTYSSGMFARLAFAVSINVDPDILIIDEALSVGDYFFQSKCYKKFEEFREKNKTILFVSHDMGSILKYCNQAILLNKGELIAQGNVKEIIDQYKKLLTGIDSIRRDELSLPVDAAKNQRSQTDKMRQKMNLNPTFLEYGDKKADIVDFGITDEGGEITSFIHKLTNFTIHMTVRLNKPIQDPIFAFTIKDLKGTEIYGTNTHIEGADLGGEAQANQIFSISFTQKMYLNGGNYLLSFGCTSYMHDEICVHHRLYDICSIDVISEKTTVGYVDFNTTVEVKKRS